MFMRYNVDENIYNSATVYKKHFAEKTFLYIFDAQSIEVTFEKNNFRHLIGVADKSINAVSFYNIATKPRFKYASNKKYSRTEQRKIREKTKIIKSLPHFMKQNGEILCKFHTDSIVFSYAHTEGKNHTVLCFEYDRNRPETNILIPKSIRYKDALSYESSEYITKINAIFSKDKTDEKYSKIVFYDGNISAIPPDLEEKLSTSIKEALGLNKYTLEDRLNHAGIRVKMQRNPNKGTQKQDIEK